MKKTREYQDIMRKLYIEAMKYNDKKLAEAIANVRDLVVEYKNIIDSYEQNTDDIQLKGNIWISNRVGKSNNAGD